MPRYGHPITDIINEAAARAVYSKARDAADQVLVSLEWLTGARPSEILELEKEDVTIEPEQITIMLNTKKTHATGERFVMTKRTLQFTRPIGDEMNVFVECIVAYCEKVQPGNKLLYRTTRWAELRINRLGMLALGKSLSPYHFRHSAMSRESAAAHGRAELMHYKGAKDPRSVDPYEHAMPYLVKVAKEKRPE